MRWTLRQVELYVANVGVCLELSNVLWQMKGSTNWDVCNVLLYLLVGHQNGVCHMLGDLKKICGKWWVPQLSLDKTSSKIYHHK